MDEDEAKMVEVERYCGLCYEAVMVEVLRQRAQADWGQQAGDWVRCPHCEQVSRLSWLLDRCPY